MEKTISERTGVNGRVYVDPSVIDKCSIIGVATGICGLTFATFCQIYNLLDKESVRKIRLVSAGIGCVSAIPIVAKGLDEEKIQKFFYSSLKKPLTMLENS